CAWVAVGLCVGCVHQPDPPSTSSPPGEEVARLRRDDAALRRRLQMLEDRVLRLERAGAPMEVGMASPHPEPERAPVRRAQAQPSTHACMPGERRAGTKSVRLGHPSALAPEADAAWWAD